MRRRCCSAPRSTFDRFPRISSKMLVVSRRCAIFVVDILKRCKPHLIVSTFFISCLSAIRTLHLCAPHENSVPSAPASEGVYPLRVGCKPGFVFQQANQQSPCVLGACDSAARRAASPAGHLAIVAPPGTARQLCNPEGCHPLAGG